MLPEHLQYKGDFWSDGLPLDDVLDQAALLLFLSWYVFVSLIAPFFVASGFSLYLNQRTLLEAWDIELIFRRMTTRLDKRHKSALKSSVP